jgi:hypothetical protein
MRGLACRSCAHDSRCGRLAVGLTGPGPPLLGVAGLVLIPLAALALGLPGRAAVLASGLVYGGVVIWAYRAHFSPVYSYAGPTDSFPGRSAVFAVTRWPPF